MFLHGKSNACIDNFGQDAPPVRRCVGRQKRRAITATSPHGACHVQTRGVKLSCCIPTLNRSRSLARAIRSLCNQTLEPGSCEILIVDNGSSDNTRGETEGIMREMPHHRIRYLFEPEPGLLSGRHRGALESNGEILVFLDDDIEAAPGYLHAIFGCVRRSRRATESEFAALRI